MTGRGQLCRQDLLCRLFGVCVGESVAVPLSNLVGEWFLYTTWKTGKHQHLTARLPRVTGPQKYTIFQAGIWAVPFKYHTQILLNTSHQAVIMIIMIKIMSTRLPVPNSSILKFSISIVYVLMQGTYPYINCCLIQDTFWNSSAIGPFTPGTFARCLDAGGTGVRLSQELAFLQWRNLNKTWECKGKLPRRNSRPEK